MNHIHYLPPAPGFFAILVGFFFLVLILRSVRYAYESLGVSSNMAIFLLLATLIGSFFNVPITELPPEGAMSHHHVDFFGMRYAVPVVSHGKGTVVAVNVGGAVIPTLMSIYLLIKRELWVKSVVATAIVAVVIHWMAAPVPGLGIAVPVFMPVVVTAIVAVMLSREWSCHALLCADVCTGRQLMSALAPKADIADRRCHVRFVPPQADFQPLPQRWRLK